MGIFGSTTQAPSAIKSSAKECSRSRTTSGPFFWYCFPAAPALLWSLDILGSPEHATQAFECPIACPAESVEPLGSDGKSRGPHGYEPKHIFGRFYIICGVTCWRLLWVQEKRTCQTQSPRTLFPSWKYSRTNFCSGLYLCPSRCHQCPIFSVPFEGCVTVLDGFRLALRSVLTTETIHCTQMSKCPNTRHSSFMRGFRNWAFTSSHTEPLIDRISFQWHDEEQWQQDQWRIHLNVKIVIKLGVTWSNNSNQNSNCQKTLQKRTVSKKNSFDSTDSDIFSVELLFGEQRSPRKNTTNILNSTELSVTPAKKSS